MKNRKLKKTLYLALIVGLAIMFKYLKWNKDESFIVKLIVGLVGTGVIVYEAIYLPRKIKWRKKKIRESQVSELKDRIGNQSISIDSNKLPADLKGHLKLFEKWGIEPKILREDLYENATKEELLALKTIEVNRETIDSWLINDDLPELESKAVALTVKAYDELGLWTWK